MHTHGASLPDRPEDDAGAHQIKTRTFLANLPMFQGLSAAELDRIAEGTTEVPGREGADDLPARRSLRRLPRVVYGQVKLAFVSPQGTEKVIDILGPGQSFGEAMMFSDRAYVVYGQALTDSLLLHISKAVIDTEIDCDPHLARRMLAGLAVAGWG